MLPFDAVRSPIQEIVMKEKPTPGHAPAVPRAKSLNRTEFLTKLYLDASLVPEDTFNLEFGKRKLAIITRSGIEKLAAHHQITVTFECIKLEAHFSAVKATGRMLDENGSERVIETFGSALHSAERKGGTTTQLYCLEISEKRAHSRVVLKLLNAYCHQVFSQDESESFQRPSGDDY